MSQTTIKLLDDAKAASGCASDYAFGKKYGFSTSRISNWRRGDTFDDIAAARIAEILGREPGEVMALCAADRAKDAGVRSRWLRVAALLAAAVIPPAAGAKIGPTSDNYSKGICIMSNAVRRLLMLEDRNRFA